MKTAAEFRRANLERLIKDLGTLERVAEAAGSSSVYLSMLRNRAVDQKTGRARDMGSAMARRIEQGLKKPPGWMDVDHASDKKSPPRTPTPAEMFAPHKPTTESDWAAFEAIQWLSEDRQAEIIAEGKRAHQNYLELQARFSKSGV